MVDTREHGARVGVLLAGALSVLFAAPAMAEDLLTVYQRAVQNDPGLRGAGFQHQAAAEGVRQARAALLPDVSFDAEHIETRQDIVSSDNTVFAQGSTDFPTDTYTLTLTQPLFDWAAYVGYKQSQADLLRADAEYLRARQDLMLQVAERYLAVLAAQDELRFVRAEKAAVARQLKRAQERLGSGMARITDLHDARSRFASVETDEIDAENALDDAIQALAELTGPLDGELARLAEEIDLVRPDPESVDQWIESAVNQNPRVVLLKHSMEVARQEARRQKAGHYPTLDLTARYNNRETDGTLFGGGSEVETTDLSLRFRLPIYQGGATSARAREAAFLYQKAREDFIKEQRAVSRETRSAYRGVLSSISRVRSARQFVTAQQLALEARRESFRSGLETAIMVLDAERDLYSAKRDYARARYDYVLDSLRLKHAVGSLQASDIQAANNWFEKAP